MKKSSVVIAAAIALAALSGIAEARHGSSSVRGYYRSNGTYVAPHHRSGRDGYHNNNWSVRGNTNPYTGRAGTRERW
ncbi:MAG: hypothetical protein IJ523_02740 [Succinivibrionaceae bacterium]|nr:hypothetical protein [Succinivibrionaceae bacterium]